MQVMFTSVPAHGHVLPLLPLARAARDAGEAVSFATGADFGDIVAPLAFTAVGPSLGEIFAESERRVPAGERGTGMHVAGFADFFGPTRIDLTFLELRALAGVTAPDLVVAERDDMVGPLLAAELGVPWVRLRFSPDFPAEVTAAIVNASRVRAVALGIVPTEPIAEVDCWPEVLQPEGWQPVGDRITMAAEPFRAEGASTTHTPAADPTRPRILVSAGTMVDDPEVVRGLISALAGMEVEMTLTGRRGGPWPLDDLDLPIHQIGFAPLAELLAETDVAVVAGGAGTVAGALAAGTRMVIVPQVFDQFAIAELAATTGAAIVLDAPERLGEAVGRILAEPSFAQAAAEAARRIAAMGSAEKAWSDVRERL